MRALTPEALAVLGRAQQFAANVHTSSNDPDWWHILRMEALRVRNELHFLRTGERVVEDEPPQAAPPECPKCGAQGTESHVGACASASEVSVRKVPRRFPR